MTAMLMPVLFIGHGSPMTAIRQDCFSQGIEQVAKTLPRPKAILCISAHWETRGTAVTAMEHPRTIHDFGGFPRELYEVEYPAPGSPALAERVKALVSLANVRLDVDWGLDHGCWSVVKYLFPEADVPIVELSLDYEKSAAFHYALARELAALRSEGVMIVASGNVIHNLRMIDWDRLYTPDSGYDWAYEVHESVKNRIAAHDHEPLINYTAQGRAFGLAAPTPDHFLPMLYALALQKEGERVEFFNDKLVGGSLDMTSFVIR